MRIFTLRLGPSFRAVALAGLLASTSAMAQEADALNGVALVIGQSDYGEVPALPNPANDAREMVKLLTDLGFDARSVTDRDARKLRRDLERFAEDAEEADVALLYYSGHGIEAGGENWLVPVDAGLEALDEAEEALVPLSAVLDELRQNVSVTIVLLDACRTNPFPAGSAIRREPDAKPEPISQSGLTPVRGAAALNKKPDPQENLGMVIGFAAEPGEPALDGSPGGNSPYAAALLRHLSAMQGVEFGQVMRMVTEEVYLATGAQQRPWTNESLRRLLYFGLAPEEPGGVDGKITGERRQLLLTMADLPSVERVQVEKVAAREGVKLDALYGVLRAMGTDVVPDDPSELDKLLESQAERLREMMGQRAALRTDDPEIAALSAAADRALAEGAIRSAKEFLDQAVARVEETSDAVDDLEEQIKNKRLADAAVYAKRADASALTFAFREAAADYARAFDLVEKWDEDLAWNYKNQQAEALRLLGEAKGDRTVLQEALDAYRQVLDLLPNGEKGRDWAITKNNMAVVLNGIGELEEGAESLSRALESFEEVKAIFAAEGDDLNWAAAENNIGNILLLLAERSGDMATVEKALAAYRAAVEKRDRATVPLDWAFSQNNIGLAEFKLAEPRGDAAGLGRAEAAYRVALEVLTKDSAPIDWAMVQNNLGNTLNALGLVRNEAGLHDAAAEAFEASMSVRTREAWPHQWATSQIGLGNALNNRSRHEWTTWSLSAAIEAYEGALGEFDRARAPLHWASAQNNLGAALQTVGQRNQDMAFLERSAAAFRAAREIYAREKFPLDWAMTLNNEGNTLRLMAAVSGEPKHYESAVAAYRDALAEFRRDRASWQWALVQASLGDALQYLSNHEAHTDSLKASIEARRMALEVLTPETAPVEWANAQNGLGMSLLNLSTREQNSSHLPDAAKAFEASLKVFTRDGQPLQWAFAQNNIGDVHWNLAAQGGGEAEYQKALTFFEAAKDAFASAGHQPVIDLIDQKIALVKGELEE
ncbi:MAG TPA: caspase domain-containing protein [Mesorhizobium sp.]|jgi:uncharacterized caspase-like protein|nr:caspase domain-containing protein [Mesorhizobium sp.]